MQPTHRPLLHGRAAARDAADGQARVEGRSTSPPARRDYVVTDSYVLPVDVDLLSVYPHAHYLGKEMQASRDAAGRHDETAAARSRAGISTGSRTTATPTPIALPRGTTLTMRYTYDNSADNAPPIPQPPCRSSTDRTRPTRWATSGSRCCRGPRPMLRRSPATFASHESRSNVAGAELARLARARDASNRAFLGSSYVQAGRTRDAIPHLEEAVRLDPKHANAHNYLGGALLETGRRRRRFPIFASAAALAPLDERMPLILVRAEYGRAPRGGRGRIPPGAREEPGLRRGAREPRALSALHGQDR